ncbi:MAG: hypothetical protein ACLFPE_14470 [Bacteroidales bacterium]
MMRVVLIFVLLMMTVVLQAQDVEFFREDLEFRLRVDEFSVNGLYYFRNPAAHPVKQVLFYPFPDEALYGKVSEVFATQLPDSASCFISRTTTGAMIRLEIPPKYEKVLRIGYTQHPPGNFAKYIITTTQNWEKPFELANYVLIVPDDLEIKSFSIPPDDFVDQKNATIYSWKRKDFMPQVDFEFTF